MHVDTRCALGALGHSPSAWRFSSRIAALARRPSGRFANFSEIGVHTCLCLKLVRRRGGAIRRADRNLDQIRSAGRNGRLKSRRDLRCSIDSVRGKAHRGGKRQVSSTAKASTVQYDLTFTPTTGIPTTPGSGAVRPKPKAEESVERRQVTVLFCDLVGSTALAGSRTSPKLPDC